MSTSIQKSILQRARDFLQTADTVSATELYTQLEQYRNEIYPDRFIDDETKKNVEQRFAEAQNLLTELFHFIQAEAGNKNPTEMVRYKPIYRQYLLEPCAILSFFRRFDENYTIRDTPHRFNRNAKTIC